MNEWMQLGRYRIEEYLGSGSYAIVYRALDTLLDRVVALKVLKPIWTADEEIFARFLREARAAANLIHPNIAWVLDIGEIDEKHFLAIRYIDGLALDKMLSTRGPIPWVEAVNIFEQIGSALDFAHSQGMVHRDIKPQNILVSSSDGAVLTDFGLVKPLRENSKLTYAGAVVGTPQYIAPEVWNGQPSNPTSDQYGLTCVFIEMLTGKILFEGVLLESIIQKHLKSMVMWDELPDGVPADAEQALRKALSQNPEDRYPSLGEMVSVLRALKPSNQGEASAAAAAAAKGTNLPQPGKKITKIEVVDPTSTRRPTRPRATGELPTSGEWRGRILKLYSRIIQTGGLNPAGLSGYQLVLMLGEAREQVFKLAKNEVLIGRGSHCGIILSDPDISREHARILYTPGGVKIKDLRSTNGTFVNSQRVLDEQEISPGDEIKFGKMIQFLFEKAL